MRIVRRRVQKAIERYAEAVAEDSWKGGGDPADISAIERELKESKAVLDLLIKFIVPERGFDVERTDLDKPRRKSAEERANRIAGAAGT